MIELGPLRISIVERAAFRAGAPYPMSSRAFAILEALLAARGDVVTKDALLEHAWPDTIVEENNLQVHIVAIRRALGQQRELLRTIPGRGYVLLAEPEAPPRQSMVWSQGLPFVDTLFGRAAAVANLLALFRSRQAITLTGAGGIGKTSLAVELCRDTGDLFVCIRYVSLAPIQNDHQAREALLAAFSDVVRGSAMTVEELAGGLRRARCLVILDNCEHLIDSAACIAQTLIAGNPGVRVLATSREALRIAAETVYPVATLASPPEAASPDETTGADAVKLFLHRLHRHAPEFAPDASSLEVIAEICRRLDGIPLAIELAAARAATLGLDTVREHLDDRFALLTGGSRDALPRHQTLRAVFEWSYRLLSEPEQVLFRHASAFVDGCSLEAASAMVGRLGMSRADVAQALAGLVAKSLLYVDRHNRRRFRPLESTRAYARTLLDHHGETAAASHAHAVYFRDFFEKGPYRSDQIRIEDAHDVISAEIGNMRAAMSWALGSEGNVHLGIDLAGTAVPMLFELPRFEECVYWANRSLDALQATKIEPRIPRTRLRILTARASALVYAEGPKPAVDAAWHEALALADAQADHSHRLRAIWGLWNLRLYAGRPLDAMPHARRFQQAAREFGSPLQAALGRRIVGMTLHYEGQHEPARDEMLAALATPEMQEVRWATTGVRTDQIAATRALLARIEWFLGRGETALQQVELAEEAARAAGHALTLAYVLIEASIPLAILARNADMLMPAVEALQKECRQSGLRSWLHCCGAFEWIARAMEQPLGADALRRMEAAIAQLEETHYLSPLPMVLGEFARALHAAGQPARAVSVIDRAILHGRRRGSVWYEAELTALRARVSGTPALAAAPVEGGEGDALRAR